jgi:hypothetical protein
MPNALIGIIPLKPFAKNATHVVVDVTPIARADFLKANAILFL